MVGGGREGLELCQVFTANWVSITTRATHASTNDRFLFWSIYAFQKISIYSQQPISREVDFDP